MVKVQHKKNYDEQILEQNSAKFDDLLEAQMTQEKGHRGCKSLGLTRLAPRALALMLG